MRYARRHRKIFPFDEPRRFGLNPDIIFESSAEKIILNTKWKFKISDDDMYQMFAYAKRYDASKIFLLCPPQVEEDFYRAKDFSVQIRAVDLFDMRKISRLF